MITKIDIERFGLFSNYYWKQNREIKVNNYYVKQGTNYNIKNIQSEIAEIVESGKSFIINEEKKLFVERELMSLLNRKLRHYL